MEFPQFKLEEFLAQHEFATKYMLCGSDTQTFTLKEILAFANDNARELWDTLSLGYTPSVGAELLRNEIAKLYPGLTGENILCVSGSESGIFATCLAMLKKDDHVITITPCYQSLASIPNMLCATTKISLQEDNNWHFDLDQIKKSIRSNTKMIVINFPHNPTGTMLTHQQYQDLIALAQRHDLWIFSDEVFRFLEYDERMRLAPCASVYPQAISLGAMSKAFGLSGLKVGWIACQDKMILKKINQVKQYFSLANSSTSEILAFIALQASKQILKRNNEIIEHNIELLDHFFEKYQEWFSWVRPQAGCVGFVKFHAKLSPDILAKQLIAEEEVLILPGSVFDYSHYFRIGYGRLNMPEALARFERFIKRYHASWD